MSSASCLWGIAFGGPLLFIGCLSAVMCLYLSYTTHTHLLVFYPLSLSLSFSLSLPLSLSMTWGRKPRRPPRPVTGVTVTIVTTVGPLSLSCVVDGTVVLTPALTPCKVSKNLYCICMSGAVVNAAATQWPLGLELAVACARVTFRF